MSEDFKQNPNIIEIPKGATRREIQMATWIDDRSPDKSGMYLVTTRNGWVGVGRYGYGLYKHSGWSGNLKKCVIAWKPMPEKYTGGNKNALL